MKMAKILIIDDEVHIIELARLYLQRDGFQWNRHQGTGRPRAVSTTNPDLIILDIMLPDIDGF